MYETEQPSYDNNARNSEGYPDPTVQQAMRTYQAEEYRFHKILDIIFKLCDLGGFRLEGRIRLVSKKSGNVFD